MLELCRLVDAMLMCVSRGDVLEDELLNCRLVDGGNDMTGEELDETLDENSDEAEELGEDGPPGLPAEEDEIDKEVTNLDVLELDGETLELVLREDEVAGVVELDVGNIELMLLDDMLEGPLLLVLDDEALGLTLLGEKEVAGALLLILDELGILLLEDELASAVELNDEG